MQSIRAANAVGVELSHYYRQPTSIIIEIYEEIFEEKKIILFLYSIIYCTIRRGTH